ncbi:MAG: hypothetical protein MZV70_05335 [Desulfobacterales bacterium]|nr:hypothetical protein [Desulfobacterales bacterium]
MRTVPSAGGTLMLQAATATSTEQFSRALGMRLADTLIRKLGQTPEGLLAVLQSGGGNGRRCSGGSTTLRGTPNIVGCTSDGEISSDGLSLGSVVLGGIASDQVEFDHGCRARLESPAGGGRHRSGGPTRPRDQLCPAVLGRSDRRRLCVAGRHGLGAGGPDTDRRRNGR